MPLLDLHAHFPMHTRFPPRCTAWPPPQGKQLEYWAANLLINYQGGQPRVSLDELCAGEPGGIASVLYDPDDEFFHSAEPVPEAFSNLLAQMDNVETEIAGRLRVACNPSQVADYLKSGERFLLHCVEGAFSLGGSEGNVDVLADRGVAYVVVAHLFYRGVAGCENALPFTPDLLFETFLNPEQTRDVGLTPLGQRIVERLLKRGIIPDITHCNELARNKILGMAADFGAPVISSHTGVRSLSDYRLNLPDDAVRRIADSGGVIGIILAPYWLRQPNQQVLGPEDVSLVFRAIDAVVSITASYEHVCIGSDLDGFVHPIRECSTYGHTRDLATLIRQQYGKNADRILYANALETLGRGWKGA